MSVLRIVFVCRDNICRSPTAEYIFKHYARNHGFASKVKVSSKGTHVNTEGTRGAGMHETSERVLKTRFGDLGQGEHSASPVSFQGLKAANLIVCMDMANRSHAITACRNYGFGMGKSVGRIVSLLPGERGSLTVEDPYGKPDNVFEEVLGRIDLGCKTLARSFADQFGQVG